MKTLLEVAESGMVPKALLTRPTLLPRHRWWLEAFFELSAARHVSEVGPQPVSLTEVLAYCQLLGVQGSEDRLRFHRIIRALDRVYFEDVNRRHKAASK